MSLIKNIYRDYGNFILDIPTWEISDTGVTALSGASGSGKTSLLRILVGLDEVKNAEWVYRNTDLMKLPIEEKRLGVVFQSYELFPHMTARENIIFAARARKIENFEPSFDKLVEALKLEKCLKTKASKLSGGEKQRVALARALIGQPRWLFLDEPFSALDEDTKSGAREMVKNVISEWKTPTILITHDSRDIEAMASSIARIESGRMISSD